MITFIKFSVQLIYNYGSKQIYGGCSQQKEEQNDS